MDLNEPTIYTNMSQLIGSPRIVRQISSKKWQDCALRSRIMKFGIHDQSEMLKISGYSAKRNFTVGLFYRLECD